MYSRAATCFGYSVELERLAVTKNLASKIRNVCGICLIFITETNSLSTLICRKYEELVSKASEFRQRSQIMQRNWNKSIQWRVVFWSNCRHRVNRLLSSGTSLQPGSPAQANISVKWGWLPIRLLRFVTFVLLPFSVRSLHLFVASLVFRKSTSCCVLNSE